MVAERLESHQRKLRIKNKRKNTGLSGKRRLSDQVNTLRRNLVIINLLTKKQSFAQKARKIAGAGFSTKKDIMQMNALTERSMMRKHECLRRSIL